MDTKNDIETRKDIDVFIRSFYKKIIKDKDIGIIFTEVVPIDWEHHIPLIIDFWETILLDHPLYHKNAMEVHYKINKLFPLKKEHFEAWLYIFNNTIDEMFEGKITELAKKRADSIASLMEFKMNSE
jgi:hemoglobin